MTTSLLSNRLASRVTAITGASSGLGRAIALAFVANGAGPIICSDLRPEPRGTWGAEKADIPTHDLICQRYGKGKAVFTKADVTVAKDVEGLVHKAVQVGGRLDVMINNAGIAGLDSPSKIHEMKDETWNTMMNVNARSAFLGCKYAIGQFLSQEVHSTGHRGWIINTASMLGLVGFRPYAGAYCASKGAVVLLTKQIAVEYGKDKIHCNALCPSFVKTPMTAPIYEDENFRKVVDDMSPWSEWGTAEDVAGCAVFLASNDASFVTGLAMPIDGGYTAQ